MMPFLKQVFRRAQLQWQGIGVDVNCEKYTLGVSAGSWTICPVGLDVRSIIYSFGIGTDISFDLALIDRFNTAVHAFDPTPCARVWVQAQRLPVNFVYHDYGIADYDGMLSFYKPKNPSSPHFTPVPRYRGSAVQSRVSAPVFTLKSIMTMLGHDHLDLVKLDIEGGEYDVIENLVVEKIPIRQLLVEFHHHYHTIALHRTVRAIRRLQETGFRIFHISRRTYEFSLLRFN